MENKDSSDSKATVEEKKSIFYMTWSTETTNMVPSEEKSGLAFLLWRIPNIKWNGCSESAHT